MTDITKCTGDCCPLKAQCRRYTVPTKELQSFMRPTWDGQQCKFYMEEDRGSE